MSDNSNTALRAFATLANKKSNLLKQEAQLWEQLASSLISEASREAGPIQIREAAAVAPPSNVSLGTLPQSGFVRLNEIIEVFPMGKSTWWKGVKEGRFPQPVKLGPKMTAWRVEDIRSLIESASTCTKR